jgi:enamine deaminase RidA (YjgF/YER057c/UK114 family)
VSAEVVLVPSWPVPKGYANGMIGRGRVLHTGGQIGWRPDGTFPHADLVGQFGLALDNVIAVVTAAGGDVTEIASMTIFVTDLPAYRASQRELGAAWRARLGRHFPAMALVGVSGLVELQALVEIQAVAYLEESR